MNYTARLRDAHWRFFHLMGVDPDKGLISADRKLPGSEHRKFAGYPYVGSRYDTDDRVKRLLVVGLDASRDKNPGGGPMWDAGQFARAITDPDINPHMAGVCFTALRYAFPLDWGWKRYESQRKSCMRLIKDGLDLPKNPLQYIAFTNFYKWVTRGRTSGRGDQDRIHFNPRAEVDLVHEEVRILHPEVVVLQGKSFAESGFANTRSFIEQFADCYVVFHPAYPNKGFHPRGMLQRT